MLNDIYTTREKYSKDINFIDLISTDLSKIYAYPTDKLKKYIDEYIDKRSYEPDSKGLLKAREAIAKYSKLNLSPEDIFITASTSESYNLIFKTISQTNDTKEEYEVLLPSPSYPLFEQITKYSNLKAEYYNLNSDNNWQIDIESLIKKINCKTKFIVIISPNNPTGSIITKEIFEEICEIANEKKIVVIVDEVFREFTYKKEINWDLSFTKEFPNLILFKLNGISKTFALPDLKLAWIEVLANKSLKENIIEELEINNDMFLSANSITQNILPDLFRDKKVIREIKENLTIGRKIVEKTLKEKDVNHLLEYVLPEGGIHLILTLKKEYTAVGKSNEQVEEEFIARLIEEEKLFIHPAFFYNYNSGDRISLVMSIANDPEKLRIGITRLFKFLTTYHG